MDDKELIALPPCRLAHLWPLSWVERAMELGYDPESKCDDFEPHTACFFNQWSSSWTGDERDTSFMYAFALKRSFYTGYTIEDVLNILKFIKKYSKRPVFLLEMIDLMWVLNGSFSRQNYLILKPKLYFSQMWNSNIEYTIHDPIFMYCYLNDFLIAKSDLVRQIKRDVEDRFSKISYSECADCKLENCIDCHGCVMFRIWKQSIDLFNNLAQKQTSLFQLLYEKLKDEIKVF